jgi:hypothetical protein
VTMAIIATVAMFVAVVTTVAKLKIRMIKKGRV